MIMDKLKDPKNDRQLTEIDPPPYLPIRAELLFKNKEHSKES